MLQGAMGPTTAAAALVTAAFWAPPYALSKMATICSLCPSSRGCRSAASHTGGSSSPMAAPPSWLVYYLLLASVASSLSSSSHYWLV